jgi:3-hydroxymyristoyl/3-hydroxydecanoyl-(acyl carrier protein) dehydratase
VGVPNAAAREASAQWPAGARAGGRLRAGLAGALRAGGPAAALPLRLDALPQNSQGKTTDAALAALFADTESPAAALPRLAFARAAAATAELWIGPDLYHFQGHFPQQPILPGVAQIDWAISLARQAFALPPHMVRMEALKFQALIQPGTRLTLDLEWKPDKQQLEFRAHSAAGAHASASWGLGLKQ